jgi:aromatic ring-cleaving dioxygenase
MKLTEDQEELAQVIRWIIVHSGLLPIDVLPVIDNIKTDLQKGIGGK